MTSNDWIKGACTGGSGQVNTHLVDGRCLGVLGIALVWCAGLTEDLNGLCANLLQVDTQALKHASRDTFAFADKTEQKMFCTDIMMIQATSLVNGQLDHFFGTRSQADLAEDDAISATNYEFNGAANFVEFNAEVT